MKTDIEIQQYFELQTEIARELFCSVEAATWMDDVDDGTLSVGERWRARAGKAWEAAGHFIKTIIEQKEGRLEEIEYFLNEAKSPTP